MSIQIKVEIIKLEEGNSVIVLNMLKYIIQS